MHPFPGRYKVTVETGLGIKSQQLQASLAGTVWADLVAPSKDFHESVGCVHLDIVARDHQTAASRAVAVIQSLGESAVVVEVGQPVPLPKLPYRRSFVFSRFKRGRHNTQGGNGMGGATQMPVPSTPVATAPLQEEMESIYDDDDNEIGTVMEIDGEFRALLGEIPDLTFIWQKFKTFDDAYDAVVKGNRILKSLTYHSENPRHAAKMGEILRKFVMHDKLAKGEQLDAATLNKLTEATDAQRRQREIRRRQFRSQNPGLVRKLALAARRNKSKMQAGLRRNRNRINTRTARFKGKFDPNYESLAAFPAAQRLAEKLCQRPPEWLRSIEGKRVVESSASQILMRYGTEAESAFLDLTEAYQQEYTQIQEQEQELPPEKSLFESRIYATPSMLRKIHEAAFRRCSRCERVELDEDRQQVSLFFSGTQESATRDTQKLLTDLNGLFESRVLSIRDSFAGVPKVQPLQEASYAGDPRWMNVKYATICSRCGMKIPAGGRAFYYPNGKKFLCNSENCGKQASAEFQAAKADEGFYESTDLREDQMDHIKLFNAISKHDRMASSRPGYNPYALAHYARGLTGVKKRVARGDDLRTAIMNEFTDRLADKLLKAVGLEPMTREEHYGAFRRTRLPDSAYEESLNMSDEEMMRRFKKGKSARRTAARTKKYSDAKKAVTRAKSRAKYGLK